MNKTEKEAFSYFTSGYYRLKDLNGPYRDKFDKFDEHYRGYREKSDYPFAYNYHYQKVIPVIYTVLSKILSHLYRSSDIVAVKARKSQDVQKADLISGVLNYQLNNLNDVDFQGGAYLMMFRWLLSSLIYGKGIVRAYWRKDEAVMPKRIMVPIPDIQVTPMGQPVIVGMNNREIIVHETTMVYDGPYIENIPVRMFLADPEYRSIQKMPLCCHLYLKSMDWINQMYHEGIFNKNALDVGKLAKSRKLQAGSGSVDIEEMKLKLREIEGASTIDEIESDRHKANNIDIIDCYGKYNLQDNRGMQIDVDNKITWKGKEYETVCTIANYDTVIKLEKVKYGVKPFFDIGCHLNTDRYWDIGMIELISDVVEAYNNIANLRMHNAMMKVNTMIKVLTTSDIDPVDLVWKPFGIIPVDDMNEVEIFETPDINQPVYQEQIQFLDKIIQDATGIYDYVRGVTPNRAEAVGTVAQIQSVGEARIKLLLLTMDHMGIRPLLKYMMVLNTYNLPSGFEFRLQGGDEEFAQVFGQDIHTDYDFEAKYASLEPALAKENRIQNLLQLSAAWQQDPLVNQFEFKKAVLELTDMMNPDRFFNDPEQVAKQQEEAEMKQMMPQIAQMQLQEKMSQEQNQTEIIKALLK